MSAALSLESLKSQAEGLSYRSQAFIDGRYVGAASGETFDCVSPSNPTSGAPTSRRVPSKTTDRPKSS